MDCLIELLLKKIIRLCSDNSYINPLRGANMRAAITLDQSLLGDGLEFRQQCLRLFM